MGDAGAGPASKGAERTGPAVVKRRGEQEGGRPLPDGAGRPCKQAQAKPQRAAEAREVTRLQRWGGAESKRFDRSAPLSEPVKGKHSPRAGAPAGCAPRRACRAASASPGP